MKKTSVIILFLLLTITLNSQTIKPDVLASSGGSGVGQDVSLCWTIGEGFTSMLSNNNYILQQGFHQGFILLISAVENLPDNFQITAYPNPVNQLLKVELPYDSGLDSWSIEVFNSEGKLIMLQAVTSKTTAIDFSPYSPAGYLVCIIDKQGHYKVFNIIKK